MRTHGFSLKEGILAGALVLAIVTLAVLATVDMSRRSRDTVKLAVVRNIQAGLEDFRRDRASYPATLDPVPAAQNLAFKPGYVPAPDGCGPDLEQLCNSYTLNFTLEGQVGTLSGGDCSVGPQGLTCHQVKAK
jgi:type II secretory pathway pseudopilin PulG